ncbi:MAG: hypothetical protein LN417_04180 [Candidatus Thermoplasmatota archaeon]|nr:hypothetical protein [Candidatus Thermoplasmatota archaeon]
MNESLHAGLSGVDLHVPQIHGPAFHTDQARALWIPAVEIQPSVVAAANLTLVADTPVWQIPDGAAETLVSFMQPPLGSDHGTLALSALLATATGNVGLGNATIVSELTGYSAGDGINAAGGGVSQDIPVPASALGINTLFTANLTFTLPLVPGDQYYAVVFTRRGDLPGTDTYAGEIYLVALRFDFTFEQ